MPTLVPDQMITGANMQGRKAIFLVVYALQRCIYEAGWTNQMLEIIYMYVSQTQRIDSFIERMQTYLIHVVLQHCGTHSPNSHRYNNKTPI